MSQAIAFERVGSARCSVGEAPLWHAGEQAWYWVDIVARTLWRCDATGGAITRWTASEMVACLAARAGGGLIAGMESGVFALSAGSDITAGPVMARLVEAPAPAHAADCPVRWPPRWPARRAQPMTIATSGSWG